MSQTVSVGRDAKDQAFLNEFQRIIEACLRIRAHARQLLQCSDAIALISVNAGISASNANQNKGVFSALAQGLLTDRYLHGVPQDSRAARDDSTVTGLDDGTLDRVRSLDAIAKGRGQKLAQLALQWVLRDDRVTSAVIGASSVEQLDTNLDALDGPPLGEDERAEIDRHAVESGVNLWAKQTAE